MDRWLERTKLLIGDKSFNRLKQIKVVIVGLGGVGGSAAEAICRAGVENIMLVDFDRVDITNLNRQVISTRASVGHLKTDICADRLIAINPDLNIVKKNIFYSRDTSDEVFSYNPDFIVDAIDIVTSKIDLIFRAKEKNINIVSCLGTGNRTDPTKFSLGKLEQTKGYGCGLSRVLRKELRKLGILDLDVVFSKEIVKSRPIVKSNQKGRHSPGSISFNPPVAGYILASYVINTILNQCKE